MAAYMGLDMGAKRVGVAISDELGMIAQPHAMIEFRGRKQLLEELQKIIQTFHVGTIVVGLPKTMKGEIKETAQWVTGHVDWFKAETDPVLNWVLWDERFTTQEVERMLLDADMSRQKRKDVRDQLAAQRILQSYLDCHRHKKDA